MKWVYITLIMILLILTVSMLMACEPGIDIRIHNQTDETLQIFIDGEVFIGDAIPGGEVVWGVARIFPHYTITAKDIDGEIVYTADFTRDDLKGKKTYDVYFPPLEDEAESSDK